MPLELCEASRVFGLESVSHRRTRIARRSRFRRAGRKHFGDVDASGSGAVAFRRIRSPAAAQDRDRPAAARLHDACVQRRISTHGMADNVRTPEREPIQYREDIGSSEILAVTLRANWYIRRRIATGAKGNAVVRLREGTHLHLPAAMIAGEFVHEHDRRAGPHLLVVEADTIVRRDVRHRHSPPELLVCKQYTHLPCTGKPNRAHRIKGERRPVMSSSARRLEPVLLVVAVGFLLAVNINLAKAGAEAGANPVA